MQTHTRIHTDACAEHTHAHTCVRACKCTQLTLHPRTTANHTRRRAHMHIHTCRYTHVDAHTYIHISRDMHIRTHVHICRYTHNCAYTHTQTHSHEDVHARVQIRTCRYIRMQTHADAHMHARTCRCHLTHCGEVLGTSESFFDVGLDS